VGDLLGGQAGGLEGAAQGEDVHRGLLGRLGYGGRIGLAVDRREGADQDDVELPPDAVGERVRLQVRLLTGDFEGEHGAVEDESYVLAGGHVRDEAAGLPLTHVQGRVAPHFVEVGDMGLCHGDGELLTQQADEFGVAAPLHEAVERLFAGEGEG
jgi:hypothetical protein